MSIIMFTVTVTLLFLIVWVREKEVGFLDVELLPSKPIFTPHFLQLRLLSRQAHATCKHIKLSETDAPTQPMTPGITLCDVTVGA